MCRRPCQIPLALYQACHGIIIPAEGTICTAGPGGNPFFDVSWLAVAEISHQGSGTEAPQHSTRLTYLPNLQASFKSNVHLNQRQAYANSKTG